MSTQRLELDENAKDLVVELALVAGQNYTAQVPPGSAIVEYGETEAAAADIGAGRHYLTPGLLFPFTVPAAGKAWMRAHVGESEVAITEAP